MLPLSSTAIGNMNMNIADEYALVKQEIEALETKLDSIKAKIKATGRDTIEGSFATINVSLQERTSLNAGAVKLILSDAQFAAVSKTTTFETIRYKVRAVAAAIAA